MGDRTAVEITVLTKQFHKAEPIMEEYDPRYEVTHECDDFTTVFFDHVNYANLPFLSQLEELNIPYDVEWEAGCEYPAGEQNFRVLADGTHDFTISECMESKNMISAHDVNEVLADDGLTALEKLAEIAYMTEVEIANSTPKLTLHENIAVMKVLDTESEWG